MRKFMLLILVGVLLFGCMQLIPSAPSPNKTVHSLPNISKPNITVIQDIGQDQVNLSKANESLITPPPVQNATAPKYPFSNYDLSIKDVSLNTTEPMLSFYSTLSVKVAYEGNSKPSRYKVTFYDNGEPVQSKTVDSPKPEETVQFAWFGISDGTHAVKANVETFQDEKITEDGDAANNEMDKTYEILPIGIEPGAGGNEIRADQLQAQQFFVSNTVSISSISIYLKADQKPADVQIAVELRRDSIDKPTGQILKTSRISAKDIASAQWYKLAYGTSALQLNPGSYWLVVYLEEDSKNKPLWVGSANTYSGKSAYLDKGEAVNVWHYSDDDSAFMVSTSP